MLQAAKFRQMKKHQMLKNRAYVFLFTCRFHFSVFPFSLGVFLGIALIFSVF
ncbi:hypothetical protein ACS0TY_013963 [Phlomoides rotata]